MAEAYRVALAPHNPQGPGQHGGVAGVRLCHAELYHLRNGSRRCAVAAGRRAAKASPSKRRAASSGPNTSPGLGIEINEAEVKKHPFEQEMLQRIFYADGSVGDW